MRYVKENAVRRAGSHHRRGSPGRGQRRAFARLRLAGRAVSR